MTKESLYYIGETFSTLVYDSRHESSGLNNVKPKAYTLTGLGLSYRMSAFLKKEEKLSESKRKVKKGLKPLFSLDR